MDPFYFICIIYIIIIILFMKKGPKESVFSIHLVSKKNGDSG